MKNLIIVTLLILSISASAQDTEVYGTLNRNKHEIRLDASELIIFPALELNYEYVISKYSGAGIGLSYSFDDGYSEYQKFSIHPYYRQYFFNKKDFGARGLFVEGLLKIAGGEDSRSSMEIEEDWFNVGAGLVVGQKWVSENGFVFEIHFGGGRYFDENEDRGQGFLRGGILIGYRLF
ncbi:hypothetical protein [Aquimarina brevivitae]|uniref:DUF3575 domain-containing protein n=1 Tax=Aquimarina brevivitae TaxID=323412 RepID=A0A4Q7P129_9FLAO|nr:hypothetical protein [Aquimarina brevivitae]RZS93526.1 hypothetical protein EV197_2106 [Aquimarina brevivitae]